jgi:hypothetical protein
MSIVKKMRIVKKLIISLCIVTVLGLSTAGPVMAKKKKSRRDPDPATVSKESWVLSYAIVGLGVGLGLAGLCRPGRRSKEVKR